MVCFISLETNVKLNNLPNIVQIQKRKEFFNWEHYFSKGQKQKLDRTKKKTI